MADFEAIIKKHAGEDGNIPASAIVAMASAIKTAVGNEYVAKDRYKEKLTEIDTLNQRLQTAEDSVTTAESWKKKFEDEHKAFEDFKTAKDAEATEAAKKKAYRALLKEVGVAEKWRERAMKGLSFAEMELDDSGAFKNADELTKAIKKEWGDCIATEGEKGADTAKPPTNHAGEDNKPSRAAEIARKYHDNLYGASKEEK